MIISVFHLNPLQDQAVAINGDDAVELFYNGNVIDTFGDINVDGSGTDWDYKDGWAYRTNGTGPDGTAFDLSNWTFSGVDATDGCSDNDTCASVFPVGTYTPPAPVTGPTTSAPSPSEDPADVVSIFSDTYTDLPIANYDPNWGQSGHTQVNTMFDPTGAGTDFVLAYPNFNYQGTDFGSIEDLSGMDSFHVDIWVPAGTDRMVKVSPINDASGTGVAEFLVEVPLTGDSWNSVTLSKSDFTGMTWDAVKELKFDGQFNGDGSANTTPFDIYLDNIYFSQTPPTTSPTVSAPTPTEDSADVVSIYSDVYTDLPVADYDPYWGQPVDPQVNTMFDPTGGGTDLQCLILTFHIKVQSLVALKTCLVWILFM